MAADEDIRPIYKYAFWSILIILLIITIWSMITETLLYLYKTNQTQLLIYNLIGMPILLIGTGIMCYGTWVFVSDTSKLKNNEMIPNNYYTIIDKTASKEDIRKARIENTKILFSAWKKGFLILLLGAMIFIIGGITINLDKIIS